MRNPDVTSVLLDAVEATGGRDLDLDLVKMLIEAEDAANDHIKCLINKKRKPLLIGVVKSRLGNKLEVVRALLDAGVNVNVAKRGRTAISAVIGRFRSYNLQSSLALTELLIERKANVNTLEPTGISPLIKAITPHHPGSHEMVSLLIKAGADPDYTDKRGRTPLFYAMEIKDSQDQINIIRSLLEARADIFLCKDNGVKTSYVENYVNNWMPSGTESFSLYYQNAKVQHIGKICELFKIYYPRLAIRPCDWSCGSVVARKVNKVNSKFDRWQEIKTTKVLPLIHTEAGRILLNPNSNRVKLIAHKYTNLGVKHLDRSARDFYGIHDEASLQARLDELDGA